MLTELQKKIAQGIVNVFETGRVRGDYGKVTLIPRDPGHLSYGRSQTTLASGNLSRLIHAYCGAVGAQPAAAGALRDYLDRVENRDTTLDTDTAFHNLLHEAGGDPVMHIVQDQFFDQTYWTPAVHSGSISGISTGERENEADNRGGRRHPIEEAFFAWGTCVAEG